MQSVFGLHNRAKVQAVCYATTPSDKSVHRLQIEREAPVFRDVSSWPSDRLVQQIVQDGIHILVNLNGYTRGARNDVFAARPAPIQMSFMGFAGTLGAEWCDYILADTTAIPPETLRPWRGNTQVDDLFEDGMDGVDGDWVYSENVIFCRDTFFCCDHAQSSDPEEQHMTWDEEQRRRWRMRKTMFPALADDVVILGNFNQLYKVCVVSWQSDQPKSDRSGNCYADRARHIPRMASNPLPRPQCRTLATEISGARRGQSQANGPGLGWCGGCQPYRLHRCGAQKSAHCPSTSV